MSISSDSTIHELLSEHPFLLDFLSHYDPKFAMLRNPIARATFGRLATLSNVAGIGGMPVEQLVDDVERAVREHDAGTSAANTGQSAPGLQMQGQPSPATGARLLPVIQPARAEVSGARNPDKVAKLKEIIESLHRGEALAAAQDRFDHEFSAIGHDDIVAMEQQLIHDGTRPEDIQRLCDVHVAVVKGRLAAPAGAQAAPPGHPADTFRRENEALVEACSRLTAAARLVRNGNQESTAGWQDVAAALDRVAQVERHYLRKEHGLFPFLERHGITGPSQVMWGIHDEVRALLKDVRIAVERKDAGHLASALPSLTRLVVDMTFKEDNILLPMSMQTLTDDDWRTVSAGEHEFGYALVEPRAAWPATANRGEAETDDSSAETAEIAAGADCGLAETGTVTPEAATCHVDSVLSPLAAAESGALRLQTGLLTVEQIGLLLSHLPVDVTFVNERDEVAYFSDTKDRIFARTPAIIGRKVQLCHPPKSLHVVNRILDDFRGGRKDVAEFWIQVKDRHIHIRYFAVRDDRQQYRGTLEVTQDITDIKRLEGERRLLD